MYQEAIKKGMEKKMMSLSDVVDALKRKYRHETTPQNIFRYTVDGKVKRPDHLLVERLFEILDLDKHTLPWVSKDRPSDDKISWLEEKSKLLEKLNDAQERLFVAQQRIRELEGNK